MTPDLLHSPLFGITLTLTGYFIAQHLYRRSRLILLNPVAVTIVGLILLLALCDIPYEAYAQGGRVIHFLLGPSVVALAVPLYRRRSEVMRRWRPIFFGVLAGALSSFLSACGLGWLFGGSRDVILSLAPKSVTTPIALGIAEKIGGIIPITTAIVVFTGCVGAMCGVEFCRLIGVRSSVATGLALGTASHGIGTARMLEVDRLGGAVAGLAIGLNGLLSALLLPFLVLLFG